MKRRKFFAAAAAMLLLPLFYSLECCATLTISPGEYTFVRYPLNVNSNTGIIPVQGTYRYSSFNYQFSGITPSETGSRGYTLWIGSSGVYRYSTENWLTSSIPLMTITSGTTIENEVLENWWLNSVINLNPYPAVTLTINGNSLSWGIPSGYSGTLVSFSVIDYDDQSVVAILDPDVTSYMPDYTGRFLIRTLYKIDGSDDYEIADSNDVDFTPYWPGVEIEQDGLYIKWNVPTQGIPDGAEITGYQVYVNGSPEDIVTEPKALILGSGTYRVAVRYGNTYSSDLSNALEISIDPDDYTAIIIQQLREIRQLIGGGGGADKLSEVIELLSGVATENTSTAILERLTQVYEAVIANGDSSSEATQEIISRLDDVSQAIREVPEAILPAIETLHVDLQGLGDQISGMAASIAILAPLRNMFFGNAKIALYCLISIVAVIAVAILRHGVD